MGSVIISPTRELARQTLKVLQPFLACVEGLEATLLVGGGCVTAACSAATHESAKIRCKPGYCCRQAEVPENKIGLPLAWLQRRKPDIGQALTESWVVGTLHWMWPRLKLGGPVSWLELQAGWEMYWNGAHSWTSVPWRSWFWMRQIACWTWDSEGISMQSWLAYPSSAVQVHQLHDILQGCARLAPAHSGLIPLGTARH